MKRFRKLTNIYFRLIKANITCTWLALIISAESIKALVYTVTQQQHVLLVDINEIYTIKR